MQRGEKERVRTVDRDMQVKSETGVRAVEHGELVFLLYILWYDLNFENSVHRLLRLEV